MSRAVRLDVALTPALLPTPRPSPDCVYVVIDVVRATTSLCVLFERDVRSVLIAPDIQSAREAHRQLGEGYLLAGEEGGLPPEGFDLGNSPAQLHHAALDANSVIFSTTNGTVALRACGGGRAVFAGALRNARAVMAKAFACLSEQPATSTTMKSAARTPEVDGASEGPLDKRAPDVVLVCSGRAGRPAFDDTLCAGALVEEALSLSPRIGMRCELGEGARIAHAAWRQVTARGDVEQALAASEAGRAVMRVGLAGDLAWCAARDVTDVTPRITGVSLDGTLLVMERDMNGGA